MSSSGSDRQHGITLVETLVALAVMGFVISGLLALVGQNTRFAAAMTDRTFASIAADNLMVEALALENATDTGELEGEITVGESVWMWKRTVSETPVENIVRIDVEILPVGGAQVLASATTLRRVE
ncbi:type II secretion system minor pseudopilin GspI [Hyphococcus sp.]|uniref:type II secretion system minor pseudopilin GspI n=1 Tax=Hyphococcus sp. TaxID=2038636 RepID=UPI003CCBA46A